MKTVQGRASEQQHHYLQIWMLVISLTLFGLYVLYDLHYLALLTILDRSHMASLTFALLLIATAHCGYQLTQISGYIIHLQGWLEKPGKHGVSDSDIEHETLHPFLQSHLDALQEVACLPDTAASDNIVEITAERFRSHVDLGWFFVDLSVRLGLLGTIIGFILIFTSLTDINIDGGDDLKALLIAMSAGMGTALLTTLTGLITASILSIQFLILGRASEHLSGLLLRVGHRHQVRLHSPGGAQTISSGQMSTGHQPDSTVTGSSLPSSV